MPKITRTLIHLFVVLLGVAFLAGFAQAEKEQKPEESLGSSLSSSLWQTQQNYLQEAEASLKEIEQKIPKLGGQIDEQVDEYSKIIKQMLRIRGLVKKDFRNYLIIKTNFERVRQGLKTELDPLDKMLLRLKDLQEGLKAQESEYKAQQKLTPYFRNYGSQATLDRILRDIKKVNQLSSDLLSIKKPVEHLLNQLENFNKEISAEIETSWKIYFFQPQKWYYKLLQLKNSWQDWKSSLPFYAHFFLMGSPDWKSLITYSVI